MSTPSTPSIPGFTWAYTVVSYGYSHWLSCDFCQHRILRIEDGVSLETMVTKGRDHMSSCSVNATDAPAEGAVPRVRSLSVLCSSPKSSVTHKRCPGDVCECACHEQNQADLGDLLTQ